ncbi:MAG TPA: SUMF1/EgtB/PvdO family nonheme iron enzyme, partial [Gemmatimonadales bacterium]|nr:SUMF1/EgtB/PvdO family nonheme iron enzyme [Gemmatimonadales bacterium]
RHLVVALLLAACAGAGAAAESTERPSPLPGHALVTVAEYASCVEAGKCSPPGTIQRGTRLPRNYVRMTEGYLRKAAPDSPVRWVSFFQAVAYCHARGMHVPTEDEYIQVPHRSATDGSQEWLLDWYVRYREPDLEAGRVNARKVAPSRGGAMPELGFANIGFRCLPGLPR